MRLKSTLGHLNPRLALALQKIRKQLQTSRTVGLESNEEVGAPNEKLDAG